MMEMVKVITIMDDVYTELYRLKKARGMSFTQIIRELIKEHEKETRNILSFAGSLEESDMDKRAISRFRRVIGEWKN